MTTTTTATSKNNWFYEQNNSSARASRFLVHFFDVHCTTTTWNLLVWRLWRTWTYDDEFSFLFLNLNKILKNSTPGKVACIWHIERVKIDVIKFEKTQIHFLAIEVFTTVVTTVVVFVAYWSKWSRWDQIWIEAVVYCAFTYWRPISPLWFPVIQPLAACEEIWHRLCSFFFYSYSFSKLSALVTFIFSGLFSSLYLGF